LGILGRLLNFGVSWLALALGLFLITRYARIPRLLKIFFYLIVVIPLPGWFAFLFNQPPARVGV
jgi:hypothetical protein